MGYQDNRNQYSSLQTITGSWSGSSWSTGSWSGVPSSLNLKPVAKALQVGALGLGLAQTAQAAMITVDSSADDGTGGCTLREAITSVNNGFFVGGCSGTGLIGFNDKIYFGGAMTAGGTINLSGGESPAQLEINSNKSVTIDASSTSGVTINAAPDWRVFRVGYNASLKIDNLTISGGSVTGSSAGYNGGGIRLDIAANLVAYNSTISNNYAGRYGGGIYGGSNSNISLSGTTVSNNTAEQDGGGIYSTEGEGTIYLSGSDLTNNLTLSDEGGGLWSSGQKTISLVNSQVTGNSSSTQGGGLFIQGEASLILYNSSVTANSSGNDGGGVYMRNSSSETNNIVVYGSDISNNTAGSEGGEIAHGGGLYFGGETAGFGGEGSENSLQNSTITGNSATGNGGGVYFNGRYDPYDPGRLQVLYTQDTVISNNSAGQNGGGIALLGSGLTFDNTRINNNQSSGNGGGVYVNTKAFVYSYGGESTASAVISGNSAALKGGGLYIAPDSGGRYGLPFSPSNNLRGSTISNNKSGNRGGGLYQGGASYLPPFGSSLFVGNSTFSGNTAGLTDGSDTNAEGGAIFLGYGGEISMTNSTISGNSAVGFGGGGIYSQYGSVSLYSSTISDNTEKALFNYNGTMTLDNSIVANTLGGADCYTVSLAGALIDAESIIEDGSCDATRSGDPGLLPLGNNGGPTQTHMLRETSIARDTGGTDCPRNDQRYEIRFRTLEDPCDVGSVEINENDITTFFVIPLPNGKSVVIAL